MQRFSSEWHANSFAGATVRKITRGMSSFDTFTDTLAFNLVPALIVVVGVTATFVWRWPFLGAVVGVHDGAVIVAARVQARGVRCRGGHRCPGTTRATLPSLPGRAKNS